VNWLSIRATLINLGFEWLISGDDNRNASMEVAYRKAGEGMEVSDDVTFRIDPERRRKSPLG